MEREIVNFSNWYQSGVLYIVNKSVHWFNCLIREIERWFPTQGLDLHIGVGGREAVPRTMSTS